MPTNYEAIGRCQVLSEQVESLKKQRSVICQQLSHQLTSLGESIPGVVYQLDTDATFAEWKELERINRELMIAVHEFNQWAPQADKRAISVYEPHEQ